MSRIAGIVSRTEGAGRLKLRLEEMLALCRSGENWLSQGKTVDPAALGWCGWRKPNIAFSGGALVVMDGHIYNRDELGKAGTDAELLLSLYEKHGFQEALSQLNGDFAIAIYAAREDTLWLARDRFGVKPLYYVSKP